METRKKTEKIVGTIIVIVGLFFSLTAFSQIRSISVNEADSDKAYCIFDSAENYLVGVLNSKTEQPAGFIIDSRSRGCCNEYNIGCHFHNWRIGIVYASDWTDCPDIFDILKRTKRMIKIGGKNYPVAQMWFDNVFVTTKKKSRHQDHTWEDCLRKSPSIIANMSMQSFYLCPYPSEK